MLFSDFARYLEADVAKSLFENAIDPIISLLGQVTEDNVNNTAVMVRSVYYTFQEYILKTKDQRVSNNASLLTRSIELMNFFKENGSRGCLGAYDNICIFLCHAGKQNG